MGWRHSTGTGSAAAGLDFHLRYLATCGAAKQTAVLICSPTPWQGRRDEETYASGGGGGGGGGAEIDTSRFKPDKGFTGADYGKGGEGGAVQVRAGVMGVSLWGCAAAWWAYALGAGTRKLEEGGRAQLLQATLPTHRPTS